MSRDIVYIINERASCRSYLDKEIPAELLNELLDLACKSPSSGGFQAISIIKVTRKDLRYGSVCMRNRIYAGMPAAYTPVRAPVTIPVLVRMLLS